MEQNEGDPRGFEDLELLPGCTRRARSAIVYRVQMISAKTKPVGVEAKIKELHLKSAWNFSIAYSQVYDPSDDTEYTHQGRITERAIKHLITQLRNGAFTWQIKYMLQAIPKFQLDCYIASKKKMYIRREKLGRIDLPAMPEHERDLCEILVRRDELKAAEDARGAT